MRVSGWIVLLMSVVLGGCSSVSPRTTVLGPIEGGAPERLYVQAMVAREEVVASLEQAGFSVAGDIRDTPFMLAARVGSKRRSQPCGSLRNVVYELRYQGVLIATITGRGWTGECRPNILDDMGAELAGVFGEGTRPPDRYVEPL